jgi:hypothetical protein
MPQPRTEGARKPATARIPIAAVQRFPIPLAVRKRLPLEEKRLSPETTQRFTKWLQAYFIEQGNYIPTAAAFQKYRAQVRLKVHPSAQKWEKQKQAKRIVREQLDLQIAQGETAKLLEKELVIPKPRWRIGEKIKMHTIREIMDEFFKLHPTLLPQHLSANNLVENRLGGLLALLQYSPFKVLVAAGRAYPRDDAIAHAQVGKFSNKKIYPWQMNQIGIHLDKELQAASVKWLLWKTGKQGAAGSLVADNFIQNGLGGLLASHNSSPYAVLVAAGLAHSIVAALKHSELGEFDNSRLYPWQMEQSANYSDSKMLAAITKWVLWKTSKQSNVRDLTREDFTLNRLAGLIADPNHSPSKLLVISGYAFSYEETLAHASTGKFSTEKIYVWEMRRSPSYTVDPKMVGSAIKWLMWKTGKNAVSLTQNDFSSHHLQILHKPYGSHVSLLYRSGFVTASQARRMTERSIAFRGKDASLRFSGLLGRHSLVFYPSDSPILAPKPPEPKFRSAQSGYPDTNPVFANPKGKKRQK